jgi:hypothetical protein
VGKKGRGHMDVPMGDHLGGDLDCDLDRGQVCANFGVCDVVGSKAIRPGRTPSTLRPGPELWRPCLLMARRKQRLQRCHYPNLCAWARTSSPESGLFLARDGTALQYIYDSTLQSDCVANQSSRVTLWGPVGGWNHVFVRLGCDRGCTRRVSTPCVRGCSEKEMVVSV